ncbi:hypothetical protein VDG1235_3419 [Verrucomicrobiia bacterium DG1235]|nr:hypothetical protein VDG1235_3419 [Verrucomicrobiae bacterium DG1235]
MPKNEIDMKNNILGHYIKTGGVMHLLAVIVIALVFSKVAFADVNDVIYEKLNAISVVADGDLEKHKELVGYLFGLDADSVDGALEDEEIPIFKKTVGGVATVLSQNLSDADLREALPLSEVKKVKLPYLDQTFLVLGSDELVKLAQKVIDGTLVLDAKFEEASSSKALEWLKEKENAKYKDFVASWIGDVKVLETTEPKVENLSDDRFATTVQLGFEYVDLGERQKSYPYISFEFYNKGALSSQSADLNRAVRAAEKGDNRLSALRSFGGAWGIDRLDAVVNFEVGGKVVDSESSDDADDGSESESSAGDDDSAETHADLLGSAEALSAGVTLSMPFLVNSYRDSVWTKEFGFVGKARADFLTGNYDFGDSRDDPGNDFQTAYSVGFRAAVWNNTDEDHGGPDYYLDVMKLDAEDLGADWQMDGRFRVFNSRFFGFANARFGDEGDDFVVYGFYTQASWDDMSKFFSGLVKK